MNQGIQKRPDWCVHQDCLFKRRAMDGGCVGDLPEPVAHGPDVNHYRLCMKDDSGICDFMVNKTDLWWLRWLFDALDGRKTANEGGDA